MAAVCDVRLLICKDGSMEGWVIASMDGVKDV